MARLSTRAGNKSNVHDKRSLRGAKGLVHDRHRGVLPRRIRRLRTPPSATQNTSAACTGGNIRGRARWRCCPSARRYCAPCAARRRARGSLTGPPSRQLFRTNRQRPVQRATSSTEGACALFAAVMISCIARRVQHHTPRLATARPRSEDAERTWDALEYRRDFFTSAMPLSRPILLHYCRGRRCESVRQCGRMRLMRRTHTRVCARALSLTLLCPEYTHAVEDRPRACWLRARAVGWCVSLASIIASATFGWRSARLLPPCSGTLHGYSRL